MRSIKSVNNKSKSSKNKLLIFFTGGFILFAGAAAGLYFAIQPVMAPDDSPVVLIDSISGTQVNSQQTNDFKNELRNFTDNEFKAFQDNVLLPDLKRIENPPSITGNEEADARIKDIAEKRGYRLRSEPSTELELVNGLYFQKQSGDAWLKLRKSASKAGLTLSVTSAYRSVDEQLKVLQDRIKAADFTVQDIADGSVNTELIDVLARTAPPGYSKHHTGYTIDLYCAGTDFYEFASSPCFEWLSADNYKIAKEYGFIPSYPPLADAQGPRPEAWEYVWVGDTFLYE
jgi:LAS superfamily LD-carboxypeptidase LdcB